MNLLLTDISYSGALSEVQGVAMLMVCAVIIIFIISWIINRISILRIKQDTEQIRDLSTVLQHTLNVSGSKVLRLRPQDQMGFNLHGDFLPEEGMSYKDSLRYIHPDDRQFYTECMRKLIAGSKSADCTFRWDTSLEKHLDRKSTRLNSSHD